MAIKGINPFPSFNTIFETGKAIVENPATSAACAVALPILAYAFGGAQAAAAMALLVAFKAKDHLPTLPKVNLLEYSQVTAPQPESGHSDVTPKEDAKELATSKSEANTPFHYHYQPKNERQEGPMHHAVKIGADAVREVLRFTPSEVDARDIDGNTPFHLAAVKGDAESMELMIAAELLLYEYLRDRIERKNHRRQTPLHLAAKGGHHAAIELLFEHGADFGDVDENLCTPLHEAAASGNREATRLLLEKAKGHPRDNTCACNCDGETAFHIAAKHGHIRVMELLLENGAYLHAEVGLIGKNALDIAFREGNGDVYLYLIKRGARHSLWHRRQTQKS